MNKGYRFLFLMIGLDEVPQGGQPKPAAHALGGRMDSDARRAFMRAMRSPEFLTNRSFVLGVLRHVKPKVNSFRRIMGT